ncbi:MAG: DUF6519 domain-containing protein [Chloroflexota bacterium]|nr:DUF6519 domain-containing protein [Chloroflexota bacterium]
MKGDFSRNTFDPKKHYSNVLMQQGRVHLDADWNEQQAIVTCRVETEARDVIGKCGGPLGGAGFGLVAKPDGTLVIGKGRYYVDGILCKNEQDAAYKDQPDLHEPPDIPSLLKEADTALGIVYLDVWKRHITALDDRLIREVALGGPDTATRVQTVWQVKVLPVQSAGDSSELQELIEVRKELLQMLMELEEAGAGADQIAEVKAKIEEVEAAIIASLGRKSCADSFPEWTDLISPPEGKLTAQTTVADDDDNPCLLPPSAGYQRLENQLYRVEVHRPGPRGQATFKWSRENGSVVTPIEKFNGKEVTVTSVGPDAVLGFSNEQWVEVIDDKRELDGAPGQLVQIANVDPGTRIITLKVAPAAIDSRYNPKLRRWDQTGDDATAGGVRILTGLHDLEGGIQVQFSAAHYKTGQYWLIPARTATGEIEWPPFEVPNTSPEAVPPLGIHHHYCRLGIVRLKDNDLRVIQDCRTIFPPLASPALRVERISWRNDDLMSISRFAEEGLRMALSGTPDSRTIDSSTMIVTAEVSYREGDSQSEVPLNHSLILHGSISVHGNIIHWQWDQGTNPDGPSGAGFLAVNSLAAIQDPRIIRLRVVLKGHVVWGDFGQRRLFLDGQAFGRPDLRGVDNSVRTALELPSGNGERASDFESWFFLGTEGDTPEPLQVRTVRFISVRETGEQPSSAGDINVPPVPSVPPVFKAGERINVVEIEFNRAVSPEGMKPNGEPQSIHVDRVDQAGNLDKIFGDIQLVDEHKARFLVQDPSRFPKGNFLLTILGEDRDVDPGVRAQDDGSLLDGDFDDDPGADFRLEFRAV